jgi:hypothetical protein
VTGQTCDGLGLCLKRCSTPPPDPRNYCDGLGLCLKTPPAPTRPSPTSATPGPTRVDYVIAVGGAALLVTLLAACVVGLVTQ